MYIDPHQNDAQLFLHYGDLTDGTTLRRILEEVQPFEIYNLGAQSHVRVSFDSPEYTVDSVGMGTLRILEAIRDYQQRTGIEVRFYQAGSSEMFGKVQDVPQKETSPFYPRSPYGCAKVYAHWQTLNYRESYDLFACNGILFNYAIDYVRAMWLMLQQNEADDYVVATGETHSVREFLKIAFEYVNLNWEDYVDFDKRYLRPAEVDLLIGDPNKAKTKLGWEPSVTFEQLVHLMVEADLTALGLSSPNETSNDKVLLFKDNAYVRQPMSVMVD